MPWQTLLPLSGTDLRAANFSDSATGSGTSSSFRVRVTGTSLNTSLPLHCQWWSYPTPDYVPMCRRRQWGATVDWKWFSESPSHCLSSGTLLAGTHCRTQAATQQLRRNMQWLSSGPVEVEVGWPESLVTGTLALISGTARVPHCHYCQSLVAAAAGSGTGSPRAGTSPRLEPEGQPGSPPAAGYVPPGRWPADSLTR